MTWFLVFIRQAQPWVRHPLVRSLNQQIAANYMTWGNA